MELLEASPWCSRMWRAGSTYRAASKRESERGPVKSHLTKSCILPVAHFFGSCHQHAAWHNILDVCEISRLEHAEGGQASQGKRTIILAEGAFSRHQTGDLQGSSRKSISFGFLDFFKVDTRSSHAGQMCEKVAREQSRTSQ